MSAEDLVLELMKNDNRPYNVQVRFSPCSGSGLKVGWQFDCLVEVSVEKGIPYSNLYQLSNCGGSIMMQNVADYLQKHKIPKSKVDKALIKLANSGEVTCKEFGKAKVYFICQDDLPTLTEEEIKEKTAENDRLKKGVQEKAAVVQQLQEECKKYRSRHTLKEMEDVYQSLQKESEVLDSKLAVLRSADTPQISVEDIVRLEKEIKSNVSIWKSRKRSFHDIWNQVSENFDGNQKDLFENIGIESDGDGELLKIEQTIKCKK